MSLPKPSIEALDAAGPAELAAYAGPALERLSQGRLPADVFVPIRRLAVLSTVEVVAFQADTNGERVLIGQRGFDPGDKWWQGRLNLPGGVVLPNEPLKRTELRMTDGRPVELEGAYFSADLETPTDRILQTEFNGSVIRTAPVNPLMRLWGTAESGRENKTWTVTEVDLADGHQALSGGHFLNTHDVIKNPPDSLVAGHEYFVEQGYFAIQALRNRPGDADPCSANI